MDAWFDIYSLTNTDERQELQTEGLKESVGYVLDIVEKEIALLDGRAERLFLGGMSQGMATILWTLLCSPIRLGGTRLGGVVAFCGWLPFAGQIEAIVESHPDSSAVDKSTQVGRHLLKILGYTPLQIEEREFDSVVSTPVFLSHGTDDAWVDVALGRQARQLIRQMGIQTEWREYLGADNDGHWIKEPEGIDDLVRFLQSHAHIN
ncbi:hypothetical protein ASPWEDRAFT_39133 [Aspergillus wentii DTO 134E9]|uniref:Phospholipase/carboxylesterase/thioesterase domain-containing protein n=1 Tax=Aspergillus wentii DTO 134E9 TaxID=1073089 RepID=A0A1L9RRH3_ASPWE|nr:uncharacterized protein ASPWEDRAFT_39133 [Aspergillus wentii DTO 134E9]OJJ37448.1 hypothetical protein ASPWEDRAFT_39133 [Aspergillus wentii DTO 134E9]